MAQSPIGLYSRVVANSPVALRRTLVAVTVLLLYAPNGNNVAAQAADFGFRFEVGPCLTERLDTFDGVFTKNLGGEPARTVTAHISLTDAQMAAIYCTIENIRFFDYPSTFSGVPAGLQEVGEFHPAPTYRFEVRNGGSVHAVTWKDSYKPTTAEADRLRDFFSTVLGFIHEHPAFKRLPPAVGGCE
jgi:hypothetical protein